MISAGAPSASGRNSCLKWPEASSWSALERSHHTRGSSFYVCAAYKRLAQGKRISEPENSVEILMEYLRLERHRQFGASSEFPAALQRPRLLPISSPSVQEKRPWGLMSNRILKASQVYLELVYEQLHRELLKQEVDWSSSITVQS